MALPPRLAQPGSLMVLRRATAVAPAARVFAPLRPAAAAWPLSAAAAVPGRRHTATESAADKQRPASAWGTGGYSINPSPGAVDGADGATPAPGSGTVWRRVLPVSLQQAPQLFLELSKARLAALVVLTTMGGYAVAPGVTSLPTLLWTTVGTGLCVTSANSLNQWIEMPYDAQMSRTRTRPLPRHAISPATAFAVGAGSGLAGVTLLATAVNPLTAGLGLANIVVYAGVYTAMKRTTVYNTWVGSVVGALPPIMGWTAACNAIDPAAALLGYILFAWQFPHFNSLAWVLRNDYAKAGYQMMSVAAPAMNARVSLRYSVLLLPACWLAPVAGLTTPWFALDSTLLNGVQAYYAWRFWERSNDQSARRLFFAALMYLPALFVLLMLHKRPADDADGDDEAAATHEAGSAATPVGSTA